jgi:hypothetical protein
MTVAPVSVKMFNASGNLFRSANSDRSSSTLQEISITEANSPIFFAT